MISFCLAARVMRRVGSRFNKSGGVVLGCWIGAECVCTDGTAPLDFGSRMRIGSSCRHGRTEEPSSHFARTSTVASLSLRTRLQSSTMRYIQSTQCLLMQHVIAITRFQFACALLVRFAERGLQQASCSRQTFTAAMIRVADALPRCGRIAGTLKTTSTMRSLTCWAGHASKSRTSRSSRCQSRRSRSRAWCGSSPQ
jgi:hypothetical protein